MGNCSDKDILVEKYCSKEQLHCAFTVLNRLEQSEEAFLGAQAILMLNGVL